MDKDIPKTTTTTTPKPFNHSRVANTLQAFDFAEGVTPEEEKEIVESVNTLMGAAMSRQNLNGAIDIYADDIVIPGRPNDAPHEALSHSVDIEMGRHNQGRQG